MLICVCQFYHKPACIICIELDIFYLVHPAVNLRITDCFCIQFHTNHSFCPVACNDTNRSDSAVCIYHCFFSSKPRIFNCCLIQNFCLYRIYLIKRLRRNAECTSAERIPDISFSINDDITLTQYHTGLLIIDVKHNCCNLWVFLSQSFHKIIF